MQVKLFDIFNSSKFFIKLTKSKFDLDISKTILLSIIFFIFNKGVDVNNEPLFSLLL